MEVTLEQAKRDLEALVARCAAGENVVLTRDGVAVARIAGIANGAAQHDANGAGRGESQRRWGFGRGVITYVAPDFDEPLEDFKEYGA
jgi:antitoxin (DNA-binding transcriptional repressor) of toxin-antitoxin stability system